MTDPLLAQANRAAHEASQLFALRAQISAQIMGQLMALEYAYAKQAAHEERARYGGDREEAPEVPFQVNLAAPGFMSVQAADFLIGVLTGKVKPGKE